MIEPKIKEGSMLRTIILSLAVAFGLSAQAKTINTVIAENLAQALASEADTR